MSVKTRARKVASSMAKHLVRKAGWHTDRQVLVLESDDWGAVRVPSIGALNTYRSLHPDHELDHYQSYDTLDSAVDVEMLFDVLQRHANSEGLAPIITMNFAMANPIFVERNDALGAPFMWEPATKTYARYYPSVPSTLDLVRGPHREALHPQLHAREHLNVTSWRRGIAQQARLQDAYSLEIVGLDANLYCSLDALNRDNTDINREQYLKDATRLFHEVFGFCSQSYVAPCYVISKEEERLLASLGIRTLQGNWRINRSMESGQLRRVPGVMGYRAPTGLVRTIRNCTFEPSMWYRRGLAAENCVAEALNDVAAAFAARQPAIVCTHRVNYVGGIDKGNQVYGLSCLDVFLKEVVRRWPKVQFMASDTLGDMILNT